MGRRTAEPLESPGSPQLIGFLAAAAAAVSFTAQHRMVDVTRRLPVVAALAGPFCGGRAFSVVCRGRLRAALGRDYSRSILRSPWVGVHH